VNRGTNKAKEALLLLVGQDRDDRDSNQAGRTDDDEDAVVAPKKSGVSDQQKSR